MNNIFITGFGAFGKVKRNPSQVLVESLAGFQKMILPVSYNEVDCFIRSNRLNRYDAILMLGVATNANKMRFERYAKNKAGKTPDVEGKALNGKIELKSPSKLKGGLFTGLFRETDYWMYSNDAGDYLCNYIYYRACLKYPDKKVGFLHVPSFEKINQKTQHQKLEIILEKILKTI